MKTSTRSVLLLAMVLSLLQGCATPQMNKPPEAMFTEGEQSFQNGSYDDAIAQWKKVKESYQTPELTTRAELAIADAQYLNGDFIEAAAAYEDFRKLHPNHARAEYALYRQGKSYYSQINRIDTDQTPVKNALTILESYIALYPNGEHLVEVKESIQDCRDKQLQYEIYVGRYYLRSEKYLAAIGRFEVALKKFADLDRRDELLYYLGRGYLAGGQKSKGREVYGRLFKEFPSSRYIDDANKVMDSYF